MVEAATRLKVGGLQVNLLNCDRVHQYLLYVSHNHIRSLSYLHTCKYIINFYILYTHEDVHTEESIQLN
jgi:hypothetical protein